MKYPDRTRTYMSPHTLVLETARSQESTLMPRLRCAKDMLKDAIARLDEAHQRSSCASERQSAQKGIDSSVLVGTVSFERLLALASMSAQMAHTELCRGNSMRGLAELLPTIIPVIRAAGAQSHSAEPDASAMLCEAAGILGSVAIDAALIEGTQISYNACARRSSDILERAKLIVDSKLSKSYPKLAMTRLGSAWA